MWQECEVQIQFTLLLFIDINILRITCRGYYKEMGQYKTE